ncbi:MAG TPA: alpha/beta hydrolase [Accumulibacter sp.]|nr:alpha/beta hydrolase [Accumulibacter sp.]HMW16378.1 alpha/beta hydrolase [Accumulibacter sp.]HMY07070.1 alpha/beta hydrolase [Accumulibacter sp.]HNC17389.1 alpha/beta hydrolase [Accumulibacter sp.]HND78874.1 alpha/beta hydrolase [Accumulibacter sp.]
MELIVRGQRCHLSTAGSLDMANRRPTLVLVHGAANDRDAWRAVIAPLAAAGCTVLVPDLPGHGLSEGPPLASIEALADWLAELLETAGCARAVIAGHSMGSLVALECAARHPQRISGLALLGSSAPMPVAESLLNSAVDQADSVYRLITDYSLTPRFQLRGGGGHGVWGAGAVLAIMRRSPRGALAIDLANCHNYQRGLAAAAQVDCPVLLLVGRRDRMTPRRNLPPLRAALRHAVQREIADCGHAMMVEQPLIVADELKQFMTTLDDG